MFKHLRQHSSTGAVWTVLSLAGFTLLSAFLLAVAWEFVLEDIIGPLLGTGYMGESLQDRWEYVITATSFAGLALIIPTLLSLRLVAEVGATRDEIKRLNPELEMRVEERTRDLMAEIAERKRAEEALRDSEARMRDLVESSSDWVWHMDADLRFSYFSRRFPEVTGVRPEELLGKTRRELGRGDMDAEKWRRHLADLEARRPFRDFRYKFVHRDGRTLHFLVNGKPVFDGTGTFQGYRGIGSDITARVNAEEQARSAQERLALAIDGLSEHFVLLDSEDRIVLTNAAWRELNRKIIDMDGPGARFEDHLRAAIKASLLPEAVGREEEWLRRRMDLHRNPKGPFEVERQDGRWVLVNEQRLPEGGTAIISTDITERKRAEEAQRRSEERLRGAVESLQEGFALFDAEDRLVLINDEYRRVNPAAPDILDRGLRYEDLLRANVKRGTIVEAVGREEDFIRERVQQHRDPGNTILRQFTNGMWYLIKEARTPEGGTALTFVDITKQKQVEEQIRRQANYDSLTELPNRMLFRDRLTRAIVSARRENGLVALLFIDLDRFKVVNDTLGHIVGDRLLRKAAERLQASVREVDTVARLGGDEFTIILQDIARTEDAAIVANKVIDSLGKPFLLDGHEAFIGASIGITVFPSDGDNAATLLRNADVAMYRAKDAGRNEYRFFTKAMDAQALNRMSLENDLRYAVERQQFFVHYQPIVELRSGRVINVEALLRWRHPKRGLVAPDEFIPLAEETGLIKPLGEWVLRTACAQAQAWRDMDLPVFGVSVNLSSGQLKRGFSRETVAAILEETGLSPDLLTFEITESLIMEDTEEAITYLHAIKEMGVGLSIDDFGTGYSSLNYLKRFPVDSVKIDRSFVRDVTVDPEDASLADAIIALAHNLGLKVIAEGVETKEQLDFLQSRGCDLYQGYYLGRPMTAKGLQKRIRSGQWSRPAKKKAPSSRPAKRRKATTGAGRARHARRRDQATATPVRSATPGVEKQTR